MTKRAWDILIIIAGLAIEVLTLLKDKIGGRHDNGSGGSKT